MTELSCLPYSIGYADEGVCLNLQIGPYSILLDCGLADIHLLRESSFDFVFCSHAHTDHCRGLLALHQAAPQLPIFGSDVTARLLPLNWPGLRDTQFCRPLPWRSPVELAPGLSVQLWPAGHMPGAACFLITYKTPQRTYSVFYSGDCFLSNGRLVDGLPLTELRNLKPDVLIVEGSYGTEKHPHRKQQENYLVERIDRALANHGKAVLPSPLLGLGQELLMLIRSHHHFTGQPIDVWVDPIVAAGCDTYLGCISALPTTVQNFAQHQPLFWDERVLPRVRRLDNSFSPHQLSEDPAIFIVHPATHPSLFCENDTSEWTVLIPDVEYIPLWQKQISDLFGVGTADKIKPYHFDWMGAMNQQTAAKQTKLDHYMLTSHSDGGGTTQLIHNLRPQHVVFVHGEQKQLADLASVEALQSRYQLHLPTPLQAIDLPLADSFWQPAPPRDTLYEGELEAKSEQVVLRLSSQIESDPRWLQFADTGVVEASWQGDELVIRGINQRELMQVKPQGSDAEQTCYACRHLRGQRCRNPESPLVGLQVTAEGSCSAFEKSSRRL